MDKNEISFIEKIGQKIPDPAVIFMILYIITLVVSVILGGTEFSTLGRDGDTVTYYINNMLSTENIVWIFDNALLANWLAYGGGVLGVILIVMFGVGIAEDSGLLTTLIKKVGMKVSDKYLPVLLVFIGIMSNIASDAGYVILIPLAGLLYAGLRKNPLIGMAAAFAGVSAGFSANLIPATSADIIIGKNTALFAESQNIPFVSATGQVLNYATMHYYFIFISTFLLSAVGAFVTIKIISPRLEKVQYTIPEDMNLSDFAVKPEEDSALKVAAIGFVIALLCLAGLYLGPLAPYDVDGETISPFVNNIILMITFVFLLPGLAYGFASKKYKNSGDVVQALARRIGGMGYVLVLTFFSYNFLALLSRSNIGTYITFLGATALENMGLGRYPTLLIIGFILTTALINLFVGGLTSKWLLLGPVFIPMLYQVHPGMTPDLVSAAYRVADSSTNIVTPMMSYAGVVLAFMKKYKSDFTIANLISIMFPYSVAFLLVWTVLLLIFFHFGLPFGY
ncbi:MAG: aminobenzoyl-glutamate transporter [Epulopiscium sp. Nele67-Bin004]|nr:MAG: aminobenzoyl-glutamate transporter [Epulopiscium sp. Nele67-Bin004]